MSLAHHPVFVVLLVAVLAPLLSELPVCRRLPVIVLEVVLGIVAGPRVPDLIPFDAFLSTMQTIGIAVVLFMAGMEFDFETIRGRPLSLALRGWAVSGLIAPTRLLPRERHDVGRGDPGFHGLNQGPARRGSI